MCKIVGPNEARSISEPIQDVAPHLPSCTYGQNQIKIEVPPRIRPKTQASEGTRQSGPSLATPPGGGVTRTN